MTLRTSMIAILLATGLSACGGSEEPAAPAASTSPAEKGADAAETPAETAPEEVETASGP
ncbi:MAG TPA: cytochrome c family protein, partial [Henriciella marina]|nr:cytochrome c family protein [Henriciella marina]